MQSDLYHMTQKLYLIRYTYSDQKSSEKNYQDFMVEVGISYLLENEDIIVLGPFHCVIYC